MKNVPTLDIRRYDTDRDAFVAEIGAAYREFGFCCISGHGIPRELIDGSYDVFQRFFALPTEAKMKYHLAGSGGARGYTPFKVETAKDSQYADLKEFWHIGREIPRDSKFADVMPPNLWPSEVPDFRQYGYGLYEALDQLGTRVLRALALHIDQPEDFFEDKTDVGNSILRPIHYPPITQDNIPNVRAGAHEDINFITLLVGASAEGLEVLSDGEWLPITTEGDAIVVNIGDMLQRLSTTCIRPLRIAWSIRRTRMHASRVIRCRSSCIRTRTWCWIRWIRASRRTIRAATALRSARTNTCCSACAKSS